MSQSTPVTLLLLSFCACGSGSGIPGGDDGGSADGGTGGMVACAGPATAAPRSILPQRDKVGVIAFAQANSLATNWSSASARFDPTPAVTGQQVCDTQSVANCTVKTCQGVPPLSKSPAVTAGMLTAQIGGRTLPFAPDGNAYDLWLQGMEDLWQPGDTIEVSGTGSSGGAPPFTISVPTPGRRVLTHGPSQTLTRGADFSITWSCGDASWVELTSDISSSSMPNTTLKVTCIPAAGTNTLVVPGSVTQRFSKGPASAVVFNRTSAVVDQADWQIRIEVSAYDYAFLNVQ